VRVTRTDDMDAVKRREGAKDLEAVPSARIAAISSRATCMPTRSRTARRETGRARLAVPGCRSGAGRENSNPTCETACTVLDKDSAGQRMRREFYETLLVLKNGQTKTWARH
jgi:hypothetical protein